MFSYFQQAARKAKTQGALLKDKQKGKDGISTTSTNNNDHSTKINTLQQRQKHSQSQQSQHSQILSKQQQEQQKSLSHSKIYNKVQNQELINENNHKQQQGQQEFRTKSLITSTAKNTTIVNSIDDRFAEMVLEVVSKMQIPQKLQQQQKQTVVDKNNTIRSSSEQLLRKKSLSNRTIQTISSLNHQIWQSRILQTKQQYNQLVEKSTDIFQKSRKISAYVCQFITSVNLFLEIGQEMLIPLNEIQKGINQLLPQKVEKHFNYLIKIFEVNFEEMMQEKLTSRDKQWIQKIKDYKQINSSIEAQIRSMKESYSGAESKFLDHTLKLAQNQQLIKMLEKQKFQLQKKLREQIAFNRNNLTDTQSQVSKSKEQYNLLMKKNESLQSKLKKSQKHKITLQSKLHKQQQEIQCFQQTIKKLKMNSSEIIQQVQSQKQKVTSSLESKIRQLNTEKKKHNEKVQKYQETLLRLDKQFGSVVRENQQLKEDNDKLVAQVASIKKGVKAVNINNVDRSQKMDEEDVKDQKNEFSSINKKHQQRMNLNENTNNTSNNTTKKNQRKGILSDNQRTLEQQQQQLQQQQQHQQKQEHLVRKDVIGPLFTAYDDESKEWSIRRNIRNQIRLLLGLQQQEQRKKKQKDIKQQGQEKGITGKKQGKQKSDGGVGKWFGIF